MTPSNTGKRWERPSAMNGPVIVEAHIDSSEYEKLILRKHK